MEPFPAAATARFTPSAGQPPEGLPAGWLGPGAPALELDVGCHRGGFLIELARRQPGRNFLGIERQAGRCAGARKKAVRLELSNVHVMQAGAWQAFSMLPDHCADCVHILFPDPWPKRRHGCRRLVQPAFLAEVRRVMKTGGLLQLITDDAPYARTMESQVAAAGCWRAREARPEDPCSEFEKRFLAGGHSLFRLCVAKLS